MGFKVLWVDDEPYSVRYEHKLGQKYNWEIVDALTAEDARNLTANEHFDILILDIILPQSRYEYDRRFVHEDTGLQLLSELKDPNRKALTSPDVPIGIFTAVVSPDKMDKILALIPSDLFYLSKPITDETKVRLFIKRLSEVASSNASSPL